MAVPTSRRARRELWLAIHLPQLALDALGPAPLAPLAVLDLDGDARVVCDCNTAAASGGVLRGMAMNSALALLPHLQLRARDPHREAQLLQRLAEWSLEYTPRVSLEPPDAVLLEVRGSLQLFGGARALHDSLQARLRAAGITAQLALAPLPLASLWFARAGEPVLLRRPEQLVARLAPLALGCTRWPARELAALATMGVGTLGECLRLPRDGFARRFAPRMLDALDRAVGRRPDVRSSYLARERYAARVDLEPELAETARLAVALTPLLEEFCEFLDRRRRAVQALELSLLHREARPTRLLLRFVEPAAQFARIAPLLRERLAQLTLPEPVRALRLRSAALLEARETPAELFAQDHRGAGTAVPQLVERLRARLGVEAVHGLCLVPEHRPEAAWRVAEPGAGASAAQRRSTWVTAAARGAARPLWLLPGPQALAGTAQAPCFDGALALETGPERIEAGWWDGGDIARDYYVARTTAGVRLWIFRERRGGGWFLHGVFG